MFRKWRIKNAFKMGKREHRFGRLIGVFSGLQISAYLIWSAKQVPLMKELFEFSMCCVLVAWIGYIISHTLEKKLFGKNGPRSGWGKRR